MIEFIEEEDCFVSKDHFNRPPFRNLPFSQIDWVQEANGLTRHLGRQEHAERQAFNFLAQGCGADHLRTTMNAIDAEVCTLENFRDCRLVLSIHDSLVYEVPEAKAQAFITAITPVARRRPDWCDFDIEISVEVGRRMGELKPA
jgi:DNA polymerase I-like protein with 3'-5' exonuclease and polymerase domains